MSDPHLRGTTSGHPEAEVRRLRTVAAARHSPTAPEPAPVSSPSEHLNRAADDTLAQAAEAPRVEVPSGCPIPIALPLAVSR
jgi:hypothetical protein